MKINSIQIDLAKEHDQDGRIIPYEEHNRYSTMPMFDIMGSASTQSVIDIRELQFEKCLHSNHRKEVYYSIENSFYILSITDLASDL
jgi:hypothetical protein